MKKLTRLIPLLLAVLLLLTACGKDKDDSADNNGVPLPAEGETLQLGEGSKEFAFKITFTDGKTASYSIKTDEETVGEALQALGLIDGEEGPYGLYVTTVGGETVKYEDGGHFWSFYINGEYANTGVDVTEAENGASYAFIVS